MSEAHTEIDQLVNRFRFYLENAVPATEGETESAEAGTVTLHREMAKLKSEVRREARVFKDGMQSFHNACEAVEAGRAVMERLGAAQQTAVENRIETQVRDILRPVLLDMVTVCDTLRAEQNALRSFKPGWSGRVFAKEAKLLETVAEGRQTLLHRLEQQLKVHGLEPIPTRECPFDGRFMKVAEIIRREDLEDGMVTAEMLPGYTWRDEVLRHAEVQVNRREGGEDDA